MLLESGSIWNKWDLHLHTASSYDYRYKSDDADEQLCKALKENDIKAVAITDHFIIDSNRIELLRELAPDIVFFPGVELRTDKGSKNLHLILVFSEQSNLSILSSDFEAIMIRGKAKSSDSPETIYWTFEDIIDFAKKHDALISIHAGRKTNGIDKEILNTLPVKEAIKSEIANNIHFFEIGQKRDKDDYNNIVFKKIDTKPLIMGSDCHNPKEYSMKESLWIKADLTFDGLKQCVYQPNERVFLGVIPPVLDRLNKNKQSNIKSISVTRDGNAKNTETTWFNFNIPLNPGLVAVIGNKGSGKSAFSDIIGHMCKSHNMKKASFLNDTRFRKEPKNYSKDYIGKITWADNEQYELPLDVKDYNSTIEDAQYLPQQYIEDVCNDINDVFQNEIDRVIFSYVEKTERGDSKNLNELIKRKSTSLENELINKLRLLHTVNEEIIQLEDKQTDAYKKEIVDNFNKMTDILKRHESSKPKKVEKPKPIKDDSDYQKRLKNINDKIDAIKKELSNKESELISLTKQIEELNKLISELEQFDYDFSEIKKTVDSFAQNYELDTEKCGFIYRSPINYLKEYKETILIKKVHLDQLISDPENGLKNKVILLGQEKDVIISSANSEEQRYQKYLSDVDEWEKEKSTIIGDENTEGTLLFFKEEQEFLEKDLHSKYNNALMKRYELVSQIFSYKEKILELYKEVYNPIQQEITSLLNGVEENISFEAQIILKDSNIHNTVLPLINQRYSGMFKGKEGDLVFEKLVRSTNFDDKGSVIEFANSIYSDITSDMNAVGKKVNDRQKLYDYLFGLGYLGIDFKLKMGDSNLEELSPGERGIVLLMFYLALSKEKKPIIIDQPEDNLDNQSVYSKLVPCICKAKQNRQVIIITHNPNIAVACDAEQIIYCEVDKTKKHISYKSGSIENPEIKKYVIDVLEGTKPAFELRELKYQ